MTKRFKPYVIEGDMAMPLITDDGQRFNGRIITHPERLSAPLKRKKPTVYALWNDLFHAAVPDSFIHGAFAVMTGASRHTFLILTKRMERMADFVIGNRICENHYTRNIWFIPTVCNQEEADRIIPLLLKIPSKNRGLSIEPMLSSIVLGCWRAPSGENHRRNSQPGDVWASYLDGIAQVILGGETGPGARPMWPEWVRSIRDQCEASGTPFFFKQGIKKKDYYTEDFKAWGNMEAVYRAIGKDEDIPIRRMIDGRTHDELPWVKP